MEKVPKEVLSGAALESKKILITLAKRSDTRCHLADKEELLYHYCTASNTLLKSDLTEDCVLITTMRVMLIAKGQLVQSVNLSDLYGVMHHHRASGAWSLLLECRGGLVPLDIPNSAKNPVIFIARCLSAAVCKMNSKLPPSQCIPCPKPWVPEWFELTKLPQSVHFGDEMLAKGLLKVLDEIPNMKLSNNERILFHISKTKKRDDTEYFILITTRRFVMVDARTVTLQLSRFDISHVSFVFSHLSERYTIEGSLVNGSNFSVDVALEKVVHFLVRWMQTQIKLRTNEGYLRHCMDSNFIIPPLDTIKRQLVQSPDFKPHRVGMSQHNCISGSQLVKWLIDNKFATDRMQAYTVAEALYQVGLRRVGDDTKKFKAKQKAFYGFTQRAREGTVHLLPTSSSAMTISSTERSKHISTTASIVSTDLEDDDDEEDHMPLDTIKAIMQRSGVIKNRRVKMKAYPNSVSGSELVDWLIENRHASDRPAALRVANKLFTLGLCAANDDLMLSPTLKDSPTAIYHFVANINLDEPSEDSKSTDAPSKMAAHLQARERNFEDNDTFYIVSSFTPEGLVLESRPIKVPGADERDYELGLAIRTGARCQKWRRTDDGTIVSALCDEAGTGGRLEGLPLWLFGTKWEYDSKTKYVSSYIKDRQKEVETRVYLGVKGLCCGDPDCERSRVRQGALCGMEPLADPSTPHPMHKWTLQSDFEVFMDDLLQPVLEELGLEGEDDEEARIVAKIGLLPITEWTGSYSLVWTGEAAENTELSIWRPELPAGHVAFGHAIRTGAIPKGEASEHKEQDGSNPPLSPRKPQQDENAHAALPFLARIAVATADHRAFVKPNRYNLVWHNTAANLYIWLPVPTDETTHCALGCLATTASSPPSLDAVKCVHKEFLKASEAVDFMKQVGILTLSVVSDLPTAAPSLGKSPSKSPGWRNLLASKSSDDTLPIQNDEGWVMPDGAPVIAPSGNVSLGVIRLAAWYNTGQKLVVVHVHEARGLPAVEADGTSSPYLKLALKPGALKSKQKGKVVPRTRAPMFDSSFSFAVDPTELKLTHLEIKVAHKGSPSQLLGKLSLKLGDIPKDPGASVDSLRQWHALQPDERDLGNEGMSQSLWRVNAPLHTFMLGRGHSRPKGPVYRFLITPEERDDKRRALEMKGANLMYELIHQMRRMVTNYFEKRQVKDKAHEAERTEFFFNQIAEMLIITHEFFEYDMKHLELQAKVVMANPWAQDTRGRAGSPEGDQPMSEAAQRTRLETFVTQILDQGHAEAPDQFRLQVDSMRKAVVPIINTLKMNIFDALESAFNQEADVGLEKGMVVLERAWDVIQLLHVPPSPETLLLHGANEDDIKAAKTLNFNILISVLRKILVRRIRRGLGLPGTTIKKDAVSIAGLKFMGEEDGDNEDELSPQQPKELFEALDFIIKDLKDIGRNLKARPLLNFCGLEYFRRVKSLLEQDMSVGKCIQGVDYCQKFQKLFKALLSEEEYKKCRAILVQLIDKLMDDYDVHSKEKIVGWVGNIINNEKQAKPVKREDGFYRTNGPQDLFSNISTAFNVANDTHHLKGQALGRVAATYAHVIAYYQDALIRFYHGERSIHPPQYRPIKVEEHDALHHLMESVKDDAVAAAAAAANVVRRPLHSLALPSQEEGSLRGTTTGRVSNADGSARRGSHGGTTIFGTIVGGSAPIEDESWTSDLSAHPPIIYLLSQINNSKIYELMTEELKDHCFASVGEDEEDTTSLLESLFDQVAEGFLDLAHIGLELLSKWVVYPIRSVLVSNFFNDRWLNDEGELGMQELLDVMGQTHAVLNCIERDPLVATLVKFAARTISRWYLGLLVLRLPSLKHFKQNWHDLWIKIQQDMTSLAKFYDQFSDLKIEKSVSADLISISLLSDLIGGEVEAVSDAIDNVLSRLRADKDLLDVGVTPARVVVTCLSFRSDLTKEQLKKFLQPFEKTRKPPRLAQQPSVLYRLQVSILSGKNLTNSKEKIFDSYAKLKLLSADGGTVLCKRKTKVVKKSHNPVWNAEFEDFDPQLIDDLRMVRFEVWEHDSFTQKNDQVGEVLVTIEEIRKGQLFQSTAIDVESSQNNNNPLSTASSANKAYRGELLLQPPSNKKQRKVTGSIAVVVSYFLPELTAGDQSQELPSPRSASSNSPSHAQKEPSSPTASVSSSSFSSSASSSAQPQSPSVSRQKSEDIGDSLTKFQSREKSRRNLRTVAEDDAQGQSQVKGPLSPQGKKRDDCVIS